MGRVRASTTIAALASEAEALWYDTTRWASFVDGLHHIARLEGDWPRPGARVLWDSPPGGRGRGRVQERVVAYAAREGQTVAVEDEKIHGTQRVSFTPTEAGVTVALELEYTPKERRPGMALVDLLFIRRPQRESLQRTLRRFRTEVAAEREGSI
ncbi:MAG TPA: SRPBCC family protein [Solirubrobacteraceae bacterium]|nr:SRPBCC family protein [Solirubrobacteraceae bacterium]